MPASLSTARSRPTSRGARGAPHASVVYAPAWPLAQQGGTDTERPDASGPGSAQNAAWTQTRHAAQTGVDWPFRTADAHVCLKNCTPQLKLCVRRCTAFPSQRNQFYCNADAGISVLAAIARAADAQTAVRVGLSIDFELCKSSLLAAGSLEGAYGIGRLR